MKKKDAYEVLKEYEDNRLNGLPLALLQQYRQTLETGSSPYDDQEAVQRTRRDACTLLDAEIAERLAAAASSSQILSNSEICVLMQRRCQISNNTIIILMIIQIILTIVLSV